MWAPGLCDMTPLDRREGPGQGQAAPQHASWPPLQLGTTCLPRVTPSAVGPAPAGAPPMGVRVSPEFCFTHWSTQAGQGQRQAQLVGVGVNCGDGPALGDACLPASVHPLLVKSSPAPSAPAALQCRSAFGGPVDPHLVLGGFPTDAASFRNFSADASAFVVTFPIDSHRANRWVACARVALCSDGNQGVGWQRGGPWRGLLSGCRPSKQLPSGVLARLLRPPAGMPR